MLAAEVNKTKFNPLDAPLLVERKNLVQLFFESEMIDVKKHANAFGVCVGNDFL